MTIRFSSYNVAADRAEQLTKRGMRVSFAFEKDRDGKAITVLTWK